MQWVSSLFTRKKPLSSSSSYNRLPTQNSFSMNNPALTNADSEVLVSQLINAYKRRNPSVIPKVIPSLRNYAKKHSNFVERRFNKRTHSDLSAISDEDINEIKFHLTQNLETNIAGGRRRRKSRRNRKTRRTNRR